ncbi:MAG: T9SS type A sorting domain-containing protein [Sphingobacteriales bacterium]|nr:T9SS type A sorting domain-containing protein [Sphingobacteriales bacterium]
MCVFGGYIFATDQEINGLTMGAVGRNTIIDFVQCSFINDDSFEWFGGTVNCSHLVAYRGIDDDFDTDFGYSGSVQYALGVRDPNLSDQSAGSTSEGFESDNDGSGSSNSPFTSAVFSNVTWIGAYRGTVGTAAPSGTFKFRRAVRIRRNSRLKVLNSIFTDAPYGVFIDGAANRNNLQTGAGAFKNNIIAGCFRAVEPGSTSGLTDSLYNNSIWNNDSLVSTTGLLESPYSYTEGDYRPAANSIALSDVNFTDAAFNGRKIIVSAASSIREVTYRGAFAPAPAVMWTEGWCEWNPQSKVYPTATDTISTNITSNTTWTSNKTYLLNGIIYVTSGVTLTIQPGTVIRGRFGVSGGTALVITKNAKIIAKGTQDSVIVFTSSKDTGSRNIGDWGGVIILGRASMNQAGGVKNIEGIATSTNTEYGGGATPNDNDNSGILSYARIEYGGYVFATDQEINGLTMGAVGRGTQIDHVQCSFINDDAFEWFGGTVNASYLVAYRSLDDNWDTDFGFSGSVQFALGVRDPNISDQSSGSTSEGFESDNDGSGSSNSPFTKALFTNVTEIGPYRGTVGTAAPSGTFKFRRAARIRRNSRLRVFNSIFTDYPYGVFIDGSTNRANLQTGNGKFQNNLIAGMFSSVEPGTATTLRDSIFSSSIWKNDSLATTANVLTTPYNYFAPDYRPGSNPLSTTGAAFTDSAFTGLIVPCDEVNAPSAITGTSNIAGCTNPQTYSIPAIANATSYVWTVTGDADIISGQGTRTITINFSTAYTGQISVVGKNDCGNTSVASTKSIVTVALGTPGVITEPTAFASNVCSLVGRDTSITYTIPAVAGATNYAWTAPSNATIVSGQGTNTVRVKFLNGYTTSTAGDTLRVVASSQCDVADAVKLAIFASLPTAPSAITIGAIQTDVCNAKKYRYSVPVSTASGFTGYSWSFEGPLFASMTIDSGSLTSRVLTVTFTSNAAATTADSVKCFYTSTCGNSIEKGIKLNNTEVVLGTPGVISEPTAFASNVCSLVGRDTAITYSIAEVANATNYAWTAPSNATIVSGQGTKTVTVKFLNGYTTSTAGDTLSVVVSSPCDVAAAKKIAIFASVPSAPSAITIFGIQTTVCNARKYRYSVPVSTASGFTGYSWSFQGPLYSTMTIDSGSLTSRVLTVTFTSNEAATTADSIKCSYTSSCGNSIAKAAILTNTKSVTPAGPTAITITALQTNVCSARKYRYSVPAYTAAGISGYTWSFQGPLYSTMTIDSGNLNSRAFTVTFTSNAAAGIADSVKCSYISSCGITAAKVAKLSNTALAAPATPTAITIASVAQNVCNARQYRYSAPALPLVSTTAGAATAWNWELIGNLAEYASIDSGDNNSQAIIVTFSSNAAAATGDSVKLFYSSNGCGNSAAKAAKMSNTKLSAPAAPTAITITAIQTNVCGERKYRYSAPALPAASTTAGVASGYVWNFVGSKLPVSIDSGSLTSRTFTATFTSNAAAATGDSVKVYYTSDCGATAAKASKLSNTALGVPVAPTTLTIQSVVTNVCGARKYRYIAPAILPVATTTVGAATGYLWTAPFGTLGSTGTIDSGNVNSQIITVTYTSNAAAATGDSIKLQYTSVCGNGVFKASKLSNTVLGGPAAPTSLTIQQVLPDVCGARKYRYIAPAVLPVATTSVGAATGYLWTAPFGTLGSTGTIDSGDVNSQKITVTYTSNVAAATGDSIKVQYTSACGNGAFKASKLSNVAKLGCLTSGTPITSRVEATTTKAQVYPNPNNGNFTLNVATGVTAKATATVQIVDMLGKVVMTTTATNNNGSIVANINNSNLLNGVYTVRYTVGNVTNSIKMVVKK